MSHFKGTSTWLYVAGNASHFKGTSTDSGVCLTTPIKGGAAVDAQAVYMATGTSVSGVVAGIPALCSTGQHRRQLAPRARAGAPPPPTATHSGVLIGLSVAPSLPYTREELD